MKNKYKASIFKALADPVRLEIFDYLRDGEKCVCEIVSHLNISQPVVSRHLAILRRCGLIKCRKHKNRRFYLISDPNILHILDAVTPDLMSRLTRVIFEEIV
ncbi:MAG: metalloregulator ArsR/SmtB family transcription factor [Candidatus Bathyarchaeia archaeon]|nr:winged helix-turn-helix transcriptional regulator [Candidatus Bathyarchaeota archaeon]